MYGMFTVACGSTWESWGAHLAEAPLWQGLTALVKKAVIVTMRTNCVWGTYGARDMDKQKQDFVYDQASIFCFSLSFSLSLISKKKKTFFFCLIMHQVRNIKIILHHRKIICTKATLKMKEIKISLISEDLQESVLVLYTLDIH